MNDAHLTFGFSEEQRQMRSSVLALLDRILPPSKIRELDRAGEYPLESYKALAESGFTGLMYPPEYGGMGGATWISPSLARRLAITMAGSRKPTA